MSKITITEDDINVYWFEKAQKLPIEYLYYALLNLNKVDEFDNVYKYLINNYINSRNEKELTKKLTVLYTINKFIIHNSKEIDIVTKSKIISKGAITLKEISSSEKYVAQYIAKINNIFIAFKSNDIQMTLSNLNEVINNFNIYYGIIKQDKKSLDNFLTNASDITKYIKNDVALRFVKENKDILKQDEKLYLYINNFIHNNELTYQEKVNSIDKLFDQADLSHDDVIMVVSYYQYIASDILNERRLDESFALYEKAYYFINNYDKKGHSSDQIKIETLELATYIIRSTHTQETHDNIISTINTPEYKIFLRELSNYMNNKPEFNFEKACLIKKVEGKAYSSGVNECKVLFKYFGKNNINKKEFKEDIIKLKKAGTDVPALVNICSIYKQKEVEALLINELNQSEVDSRYFLSFHKISSTKDNHQEFYQIINNYKYNEDQKLALHNQVLLELFERKKFNEVLRYYKYFKKDPSALTYLAKIVQLAQAKLNLSSQLKEKKIDYIELKSEEKIDQQKKELKIEKGFVENIVLSDNAKVSSVSDSLEETNNKFEIDFAQMDAKEIHAYFQVLKNQNLPTEFKKYPQSKQGLKHGKDIIILENLPKIVDGVGCEYSVYVTDKVRTKVGEQMSIFDRAISKGTISKHSDNSMTFIGNNAFKCTGATDTRIFGDTIIVSENGDKCLLINHYGNHDDFKNFAAHSHIHYEVNTMGEAANF